MEPKIFPAIVFGTMSPYLENETDEKKLDKVMKSIHGVGGAIALGTLGIKPEPKCDKKNYNYGLLVVCLCQPVKLQFTSIHVYLNSYVERTLKEFNTAASIIRKVNIWVNCESSLSRPMFVVRRRPLVVGVCFTAAKEEVR